MHPAIRATHPTEMVACESKFVESGSLQPWTSCTQRPSSVFAFGTKCVAVESVQPSISNRQPLNTVASESKFSAAGAVHPNTVYLHELGCCSCVALAKKLAAVESVHPTTAYWQLDGSRTVNVGSNESAEGSVHPLFDRRRRLAVHVPSQLQPSLNVAAGSWWGLLESVQPGMMHHPLSALYAAW